MNARVSRQSRAMSDRSRLTMPTWLGWAGGVSDVATVIYMSGVRSLATDDLDLASGLVVRSGTGRYGAGSPDYITRGQNTATLLRALPFLVAIIW